MPDENFITPPGLVKGIEEFNCRDFYQCHETLEELWRVYDRPERECIQGIIQIAVGYYHHLRDNRVGALKLLNRGLGRIQMFQPTCLGVDTNAFALAVDEDLQRLQNAAADEICGLKIAKIRYASDDMPDTGEENSK
jgi:predicted metal-dependent hydrolase